MKIWIHMALLAVSAVVCYHMRPIPPESTVQRKAQKLVDQVYGPGHAKVTVTLRHAHGERSVNATLLGRRAFVVASQRKNECHAKSGYKDEVVSEKLELPREITVRKEQDWVERTCVAVVLDRPAHPDLTGLLEAGLALDTEHGDRVQVMQRQPEL
ncbi:hypothetical protein IV102_11025 [bacterium]|nr:hypothetical protein [bacterium]